MNKNGRGDCIRTSSDLLTSIEVSRSNRLRLSLPRRMLVGLRACEHFGFRRVPTIHCFPAPKSQCLSWIRSRLPLRGSPGFAPGSLLLSEKTQRTNTGGSLLWPPIFVNSDVAGGMLLATSDGLARDALLNGPLARMPHEAGSFCGYSTGGSWGTPGNRLGNGRVSAVQSSAGERVV